MFHPGRSSSSNDRVSSGIQDRQETQNRLSLSGTSSKYRSSIPSNWHSGHELVTQNPKRPNPFNLSAQMIKIALKRPPGLLSARAFTRIWPKMAKFEAARQKGRKCCHPVFVIMSIAAWESRSWRCIQGQLQRLEK